MQYVVYVLKDPVTGIIRYVGEGRPDRPFKHSKIVENGRQTSNPRLTVWIKRLLDSNARPVVEVVYTGLSKQESLDTEEKLILKLGRSGFEEGGILLNVAARGKYYDRSGANNPMFGKKMSPDAKRKIGDRNRKPKPNGFKDKMKRVALERPPINSETRSKMSEKQKRRFATPGNKEKHAASISGSHWKKNLFLITNPNGITFQETSIWKFAKSRNISGKRLYEGLASADSKCKGSLNGWSVVRLLPPS